MVPTRPAPTRGRVRGVAWLFHIVERGDGLWACRHGTHEYDPHRALADALEHITAIASNQRPAEVLVHRQGERTQKVAVLPAQP